MEDTYTHTTETEKCDPVKDDSSSGSSTDSDGFGGSSGEKFYTVPLLKVCYLAWYNLAIQSNIYQEGCCHGCKRR